jgi:membrane-anchored protein YejM (alkaline phosphatase superfamily)
MLTVAVILFGLLNVFIYADSVIYQLWRFHFNGFVWNLITTPGSSDATIAGKSTILYLIGCITLIFATEIAFAAFVLPWLRRQPFAAKLRHRKAFVAVGCAVLTLILLNFAVYDVADLRGNVEVLRVKQLLPLYQAVTMKKFAIKVLGMKFTPDMRLKLPASQGSFYYPKAPLRFRAGGPRPNILIIPIEGARFDMLTPDVMPFLSHWSESNLVFRENFSTGNTTRYGIFGLLYGIYGTYWQRALAEHAGPTLFKSLQGLGYKFRILCSANMNYPELHSTCFVDVLGDTTDRWECERVERDPHMTDEFIKFLDHKEAGPFLGFVFYDASHQPYSYPPEHAIFPTGNVSENLNYIKLAHGEGDMALIKNRYKNSLHYVDAQIQRLMQALEQRGLLNNTLVFVMGDHGEEFREFGLFGHDSAFHRYQTQTLMVAHIPGQSPRAINRLTSHIDVPATILTYMGVENPLSDYTLGHSLLDEHEPPFLFIANWSNAALVDRQSIITFGLEAYNADTTILDTNNVPLPNQRDALAARKGELLSALEGMRQFTK